MSAAHRRTMKPSIIFDSPFLLLRDSGITCLYKKYLRAMQGTLPTIRDNIFV
jgi:hypothetical protein